MLKIYYFIDYFSCIRAVDCAGADASYTVDTKATKLDNLLNVAPASFDGLYFFFLRYTFSDFLFYLRRTFTS